MKFQCSKSDILPTIQQSQNIVGQKATLQILSNFLIEAKGDELCITSTDLELGMFSKCKVDVLEEGRTTVPAKKFFDIIRNLPDLQITIESDENNAIKVKCGKSSYKIFGLSADDFPQLPDFSDVESWEFSQSLLRRIIRQTNYAISRDESRYVLNGIYFILNKNEIFGVATDGRRLSLASQSGMNFKDTKIDFILPSKTVSELFKLLGEEGVVNIYPKSNQLCFQINSTTLISKLIEGNFPEYQAVIPESSPHEVILKKEDFLSALNRVSILTTEKTNSIKLLIKNNQCTISANSPNIGEAIEELDVEFSGPEIAIAFNPHYLMDILKCQDSEKISLWLSNSLKPGVVKQDKTFMAVIMPMRLE